MNKAVLWFTKITGLPAQYFYFKKKIYSVNDDKKARKIKGGAMIVCNHTNLKDFPLVMYTFFGRDLRALAAEIVYEKKGKLVGWFVNAIGCVRVDRSSYDFSFTTKMVDLLKKGKVGVVFPEGRIPDPGETDDFLDFKPSYVYMALEADVPIIPIYTNGIYGKLKKEKNDVAKVMIGEKIDARSLISSSRSEKENLDYINNYVRDYMKKLKQELENRKD